MDDVLRYYARSEEARWFSNGGPCVQELTDRIESMVGGGAHCVLVNNCTAGLMVALRAALGSPAPERRLVITPAYTFTATACAIEWAGFEPLLVDVDPVAWQLDPAQLRPRSQRTRARSPASWRRAPSARPRRRRSAVPGARPAPSTASRSCWTPRRASAPRMSSGAARRAG